MFGLIDGFDWDGGNWPKCGKHGVSVVEIEAVLTGTPAIVPDPAHSHAETRFLAIGCKPDGRYVFICFTLRHRDGRRLLRPISARYMRQKEIDSFEDQTPGPEDRR